MMDEQIIELLRDRFDRLDVELSVISTTLKEHCENDATYWKKIDENEAQLRVIKWLSSSAAGSAVMAWLYSLFSKH